MAVIINGRTAVHKDSGGVLTTSDPCKTGGSCSPVTFTNVAVSADSANTASSVLTEGNPTCHVDSIFSKSTGDEGGSCMGVGSGTITQKAEFITSSSNVFFEGTPAVRQNETMISNNQNTSTAPLMQPGDSAAPVEVPIEEKEIENPGPDCFEISIVGDNNRALVGGVVSINLK